MSYSEFFQAVMSRLQHDLVFTINVETWRHSPKINGRVETKWKLYVAFDEGRQHYEGYTPEEVLSRFDNDLSEGQSIEQTSAAVGSAEVDA